MKSSRRQFLKRALGCLAFAPGVSLLAQAPIAFWKLIKCRVAPGRLEVDGASVVWIEIKSEGAGGGTMHRFSFERGNNTVAEWSSAQAPWGDGRVTLELLAISFSFPPAFSGELRKSIPVKVDGGQHEILLTTSANKVICLGRVNAATANNGTEVTITFST